MVIDFILLGLALLFGFLGSFSGASRQLAQMAALVAATVLAKPVGALLGPHLSREAGGPAVLGVVAGCLIAFLVIFSVVRLVLTRVLKRMLAGEKEERAGTDRGLGFCLGAFKVLAIAYVVLSALTFAEERVSVAGRRVGLSPKDSAAFEVARVYNLFSYTQFGSAKDLVELARATRSPERAKRLQNTADYKALQKDARFRRALADPHVAKALQTGDWKAALHSDTVLQLVADPAATRRMQGALSVGE
jgi:membrane protein required for colicin V production